MAAEPSDAVVSYWLWRGHLKSLMRAAEATAQQAGMDYEQAMDEYEQAVVQGPPKEPGLILTQLATRIPKDLHHDVKVFCVMHDTSVADFSTEALRHELEARRDAES
jgi:hypothetical protein